MAHVPAGATKIEMTGTMGARKCIWQGARLSGENDAAFEARAVRAEGAVRSMLTMQGVNGAGAAVASVDKTVE